MELGALPALAYTIILTAVAGEIAWYRVVQGRAYPWRELGLSTAILLMRLPTRVLRAALIAPLMALAWSLRPFTVPLDTAWGIALLFIAVELAYYWSHRCEHRIRWMWASHVVHHTPRQIHLASAFRLGLTAEISGIWLFFVPLPLLGFHPLGVALMLAANLFYQFWLHTDIVGRLGPLEWFLNTPSHHRVHHASNAEYLDKNFGGVLIVWDRLFGTFAPEQPGVAIRYGLTHALDTYNPLLIAFHEWIAMARNVRASTTWRERWRVMFGAPLAPST